MKVSVESCFNGHESSFRLTVFPCGHRYSIKGDSWTRQKAKEAKDLICSLYDVSRKAVEFEHK